MLFPNDTIEIQWLVWAGIDKSYSSLVTWIPAYFYDNEESLNSVYGIEWGQEVKKMMTNYMTINESNKIIDENSRVRIVKKVITRTNAFKKFLEVIVVSDYA